MSLYTIIDQLRRSHPTPAASKTLDMVTAELGRTGDNLEGALTNLEGRSIPTGGNAVLEELRDRAQAEGVGDLEPIAAPAGRVGTEPLDEATFGIGMLLGGSALIVVLLGLVAVYVALR